MKLIITIEESDALEYTDTYELLDAVAEALEGDFPTITVSSEHGDSVKRP